MTVTALDLFSPHTRDWFQGSFAAPTDVQERGWPAIAAGTHTLMSAPTGSGKTLAAFLWAIDRLLTEPLPAAKARCRVVYVSPLKALTVDVDRNLRGPLRGITFSAARAGVELPDLRTYVRTGDTPASERRRMQREPADILITTPESLFLLLTSAARETLRGVRTVIVDEVHALAGSKRGAHLALSLERLEALAELAPQRIGLSATVRPLEGVAHFLAGRGRPVEIVDSGRVKPLEIRVEVPVEDMADLERGADEAQGSAAAIGAGPAAPRRSIWPAIHPRILDLVESHRSTIIFVNSRRLAERLASRLNELAAPDAAPTEAHEGAGGGTGPMAFQPAAPAFAPPAPPLVRAHHGSIAREQRVEIEEALKAGRLKGIVATSSLELGIDMGAVDLVIQVEAPDTVASGIQRIGRAGHSVGEPSTGVIFPKHRGDLLETAVVVERMLKGEIETLRPPRNPVDVLAQQLVAMSALDTWSVDDAYTLVCRAEPYADLGRRAFEAVLDMLSGRYPSEEFAELRPRVVWDRAAGTFRGRAGAQRLAVTSGGTIPDRGLYSVNLLDDGRRVGELDEEMTYELRPGQTFVLGATTWRVAEITPSQVLVTPAPGEPGTVAFWKGDAPGRPVEVGAALGQETRELAAAAAPAARRRLEREAGFDRRAADNLLAYLGDQKAATGAIPDDRTIVVERFRDQLGDWRICVLTPYGARLHGPWALAVQAALTEKLDVDVQSIHTDDGFALRLPDTDRLPDIEDLFLDPDEVREVVTAQLQGSPLFASRFRENAARALLLPRRRPGQRTPLWQQRQRAHDLLQVASRYPDFPIVLETYRECLSDVFALDELAALMRRVRSHEVRVVSVETDHASPFAASLMFDYIAQYMYEGDAPLGERRAQALTLDRGLLAELLGSEDLRELLDPGAVAALELELQGLLRERWPRDEDEAEDVFRHLGDLTREEAEARGVSEAWQRTLEAQRRVVPLRIAGATRFIAVEDAARYRDALGVVVPAGVPDAYLAPVADPLGALVMRWARTHVPFFAVDLATRWGLPRQRVESELARLVAQGRLLTGEFSPGRREREYCHPDVLRTLRRKSLAALRRAVEPVAPEVLSRFLPAWHGVGVEVAGGDRLLEVIQQLQGAVVPMSILERDVLPARMARYSPALLDELVAAGEVVWTGRGALGPQDGRIALYLRGDAAQLVPMPEPAPGEVAARVREHLAARGASFFRDLVQVAEAPPDETLASLWQMVWSGEVTNDSVIPLRSYTPARAATAGRGRRRPLMRLGPPGSEGRWSLVADLLRPMPAPTHRLTALAQALLARYGVLTREAALAEQVPGGFAALYPVLRAMEEAGKVRRGYFVDGMGGSQFAYAGAVDRLRASRDDPSRLLAMAAADPANPYGVLLPWPEAKVRLARVAGAFVLLDGGELRLYLERGGRSLLTFGAVDAGHLQSLVNAASRAGKLEVRQVDGLPVAESGIVPAMREVGFGISPRGLVLWPERRAG